MKRSVSHLVGGTVRAKDGDLGRVEEFYFDDHKWIIRYMVVDTRRWLQGRQVLISTAAFPFTVSTTGRLVFLSCFMKPADWRRKVVSD